MLLFKPTHVDSILGRTPYLKTETRRRGQRHWKINSIHLCKTNYSASSAFARIRILSVHQEPLFNITLESANNEGYATIEDFKQIWLSINHEWKNIPVHVIRFKVTENLTIPQKSVLDFFDYECGS